MEKGLLQGVGDSPLEGVGRIGVLAAAKLRAYAEPRAIPLGEVKSQPDDGSLLGDLVLDQLVAPTPQAQIQVYR